MIQGPSSSCQGFNQSWVLTGFIYKQTVIIYFSSGKKLKANNYFYVLADYW